MTTRIKQKQVIPKTREELELLVGEIAALKLREAAANAAMDGKLKAVKDSYLPIFTEVTERLAVLVPQAAAWAEANPDAFGRAKSLDLLHAVIGWRTNTPSLKPLSGWTWARVLEKLKGLPLLASYIRVKEEPNKQALIADRDVIGADTLRSVGLRVVQDEEFFVEPKLTEAINRETHAA